MKACFPIFFLLLVIFIFNPSQAAGIYANVTQNEGYQPGSIQDYDINIPVAILVMMSGFVSDIGTEYSRAFNLSKQDNPESIIRPVIIDSGSNASTAASVWKNLTATHSDTPIVVTVASWTTNIVYPEASGSGTIQIALGSAMVNRSNPSDHLVRFTPGVEQESPVLASYMRQFNRIMLIGGNNDYTNGYIAAFNNLLPEKNQFICYYNPDEVESTLNISEIKQRDPDVIVFLGFSEGAKVVSLIRKAGINTSLIGTRGIENNMLANTKEAEGILFTTPALNKSNPFFTRYFKEYHENATFFGAEGFDALNTLYSAVKECGNSSECIYSWYKDQEYEGALGSVKFDEKGVATYPIAFKIVRNGEFEDLSLNTSV